MTHFQSLMIKKKLDSQPRQQKLQALKRRGTGISSSQRRYTFLAGCFGLA
jgi:hypothetical protein